MLVTSGEVACRGRNHCKLNSMGIVRASAISNGVAILTLTQFLFFHSMQISPREEVGAGEFL